MKISAVIFDLDGTVLANEDEYGEAFRKVLESLGAKNVPDYPQIGGIGVRENWPYLLEKYKVESTKSIDELDHETHKQYQKLISKVTLKEGVLDFINELKRSGIRVALATSSLWFVVEEVFKALPIEGYFESVTTGEEVSHKKPSPDLFLLASDKLDTRPEECLVIEDSKAGIEAAHAAGMKVVGIARDEAQKKILDAADLIVTKFSELSVDILDSL